MLNDFVGLQLIFMMLEDPNEDKVELACQFMIEAGQVLSELTPAGVNAIFERLKGILHEGECEKRIQYSIEHLFAVRKTQFKVTVDRLLPRSYLILLLAARPLGPSRCDRGA